MKFLSDCDIAEIPVEAFRGDGRLHMQRRYRSRAGNVFNRCHHASANAFALLVGVDEHGPCRGAIEICGSDDRAMSNRYIEGPADDERGNSPWSEARDEPGDDII